MASLLRKVKTRLTIRVSRKVRGLLEGEYTSVFHGRSIEFDDLRHYVPGDELKDIDWKATARTGSPMTRRYIASRKHTLMILADTGRDMAAISSGGEPKIDVAVLAAGVLAYIATRHGDLVGIVAGDADTVEFRRPESTEAHLERLLQLMHGRTTLTAASSDLSHQLSYVAKGFRRRMILVVIADDRTLAADETTLLRRLSVQHEILWLTIADADPTRPEWMSAAMFDVSGGAALPSFVRQNRAVRRDFRIEEENRTRRAAELLDSLQISSRRIASEADVVPQLFRLLERHRHARR